MTTTKRRKRCSCCEQLKDDVSADSKMCPDCEADSVLCKACNQWHHDETCRHVQWYDDGGCYSGCGTWDMQPEKHRESFELLLEKFASVTDMDGPIVPRMLEQIAANNFWTQWHGPLIGHAPDLGLYYTRDFGTHKSNLTIADIGCTEQESWGAAAIENMALGINWLTSLQAEVTTEANAITAGWIREWLTRKVVKAVRRKMPERIA